MSTELTVRNEATTWSAADVRNQVQLIQQVMHDVMTEGEHYGVVPGTSSKPALFKAGAEKLCLCFRLAPRFRIERIDTGDHREMIVTCTLFNVVTGQECGEGIGSASTRESKYAYRRADRLCPVCGKAAIIKGKAEYGGGWLCFKKKDGCGATFRDGDQAIEGQQTGRVPNPDLPDAYNTIAKMAQKRALVAAVLVATAASDIFTQDLEDTVPAPSPVTAAPTQTKQAPVVPAQAKQVPVKQASTPTSSQKKAEFVAWLQRQDGQLADMGMFEHGDLVKEFLFSVECENTDDLPANIDDANQGTEKVDMCIRLLAAQAIYYHVQRTGIDWKDLQEAYGVSEAALPPNGKKAVACFKHLKAMPTRKQQAPKATATKPEPIVEYDDGEVM